MAALAGLAGWVASRSRASGEAAGLPPALEGERRQFEGRAGRISYYVAGEGAPLLLVHSINAAGSAYEVRPIHDGMRGERRVYAVDLPGFGFSDRSERRYRIPLFVDAILDMLDVMDADSGAHRPVDALAISLGCEFLARAATLRPGRFRTLAFVTPTGFGRAYKGLEGGEGEDREVPLVHAAFAFPLWSQAVFDLLVTRASIRFFLQRTYGSKEIDPGLLAYDHATAHQPGAKNAVLAFVCGRLFAKDIQAVYRRLDMPVWMPHATRGDFKDFSEAGWARSRTGWRVQPFETGALVHFEQPARFLEAYRRFLADAAAGRLDPLPAPSQESLSPSEPSP